MSSQSSPARKLSVVIVTEGEPLDVGELATQLRYAVAKAETLGNGVKRPR
jgi:hypothetical protein